MYKAGLQAGIEHPITGAGYDYNRIFENFDAKTDAQNLVAQKVGKDFQNFHSLYIDTLAKRGFVGVLLLGLVLLAAFYSRNRDIMVLTLAPTAIIAGAGLTDSVFELGITTSYFVIATTIIKSIRFA
jgi:O-antigen ligase